MALVSYMKFDWGEEVITELVAPHQVGWLRRSELDFGGRDQMWEKPDGELYAHHGLFPLKICIVKLKVAK